MREGQRAGLEPPVAHVGAGSLSRLEQLPAEDGTQYGSVESGCRLSGKASWRKRLGAEQLRACPLYSAVRSQTLCSSALIMMAWHWVRIHLVPLPCLEEKSQAFPGPL